MQIIGFEKKTMTLLTNEQQELYENAKFCYVCKEMFEEKYANNKKCRKVRGQCYYTGEYRGAAFSTCNLKHSTLKDIIVIFHNESNCDFEEQHTCLGAIHN